MASTTDKITDVRNAARPNSARVTSGRTAGGATLACDNLAGWPTASKVHFVTYKIDSSSAVVAGTQLDCYGIVSGNNIGSFNVVDGTDTGHAVGDVVEMLPTAAWGQDLADALTAQHSRLGAHVGITNTGGATTDTLTVTSGSTLPAGDIITADIASNAVTTDKIAVGTVSSTTSTTNRTTTSTSFVTLTDTLVLGAGKWQLSLKTFSQIINTSGADRNVFVTLSSNASTETHPALTQNFNASVDSVQVGGTCFSQTTVTLTGSTTFTLMGKVSGSTCTLNVKGGTQATVIEARKLSSETS